MDAHETAEQLAQIREQMARLEGLVEGLRDAIRARAQETAQEAGQLRERVAKLEGLLERPSPVPGSTNPGRNPRKHWPDSGLPSSKACSTANRGPRSRDRRARHE